MVRFFLVRTHASREPFGARAEDGYERIEDAYAARDAARARGETAYVKSGSRGPDGKHRLL